MLCVLALLLGACSTKTETTSDTPEAVTPAPSQGDTGSPGGTFDDPSAGPDRAPDEPRLVPPLNLPATAPGTDAAAAALLDELDQLLTTDERDAGVPWPDLRNPDPVAVYQSAATFQRWISENAPNTSLVEAYTAPDSPEREFDLEIFGTMRALDLRSAPGDPPYSMRIDGVVHPAATGITDALLAVVPEGSAAIVYWDSVGPRDVFNSEGVYQDTLDGWTDSGPWIAIMAPTDVGWQVWYDELIEPPPPGSRQQAIPDDRDLTRQDV